MIEKLSMNFIDLSEMPAPEADPPSTSIAGICIISGRDPLMCIRRWQAGVCLFKRRKLTQAKAATTLGLKQPDVSSIITGRVGKFSIDRLVRCLDRLDYKVDVVVRHKPRRAPRAIAA
jgi:hypothetical protein